MEKEELAYWAGFFDGEGHIELSHTDPALHNRYGRYMFQVFICQWTKTPYVLFADLLENFGGNLTLSQKNVPNNFKWHIAGADGRQFLEALLPYLREKKRQAELGIEMQKTMQVGHGGRRHRLQDSEIRQRNAILGEYYSLIKGNKPSRIRKLGQYILLEGRNPE